MNTFKMAYRNVQKNLKEYLVYFLTLMISVSMFYAFNSIESQSAFELLNKTKGLIAEQMGIYISVFSVLIAIVLGLLIIYANQFILKRRKKELGIYMTLGMEQKKISRIFILETLMIGVIALVAGLILGVFISQVLSLLSLRLFAVGIGNYGFVLSYTALIKTIVCFIIIFILVMVFNTWTISNVKLIDLLMASRVNEELSYKSKGVYITAFVLSIICIVYSGRSFSVNGIMPNTEGFNTALFSLVIGTCLFFYSFSTLLMFILKGRDEIYLKNLNAFLIRQIGSKIKSNYMTMVVVCALLTATICVISTGASVAIGMNKNSSDATPYDMTILASVERSGEDVSARVKEYGVDLENYLDKSIEVSQYSSNLKYSDIIIGDVDFWQLDESLPTQYLPIISESDFNRAMEVQGKDGIELKEDEFLLNCNYDGTREMMQKFLSESGELSLNGVALHAKEKTNSKETINMTSIGNNDRGTIIVKDSLVNGLKLDYIYLNGIYKENVNPDEVMEALIPIGAELSSGLRYTTKSMMNDMYYGVFGFMVFISCYIGFIFLLISVAVLALQQLTETSDNIYRYRLLKKLGVDDKEINAVLFKQIGVYFMAPLALAIVYSIFGLREIMKIVLGFLNMPIGTNVFFVILLFVIVYGGYLVITYLSSKRMIEE